MADENPYKAPSSELIEEVVTGSFRADSLGKNQLYFSGWLTLFVLFLSIPLMIISFIYVREELEYYNLITQSLTVIISTIWIYLLVVLQKFIEARFDVSGLGIYIKGLIFVTIISMVMSFFMDESAEITIVMAMYFALFIPDGILMLLLGKKLLSIKEPYPYLRIFAWLTIITGILFATVILFLLAIPFNLAADVFMALLFFSGHKEFVKN